MKKDTYEYAVTINKNLQHLKKLQKRLKEEINDNCVHFYKEELNLLNIHKRLDTLIENRIIELEMEFEDL